MNPTDLALPPAVRAAGLEWVVSQIGARQHYGVPRGFEAKRRLRLLYTDIWCRWGAPQLRQGPRRLRALAGRYHPHVPSRKVVSFNVRSVLDRAAHGRAASIEEQFLRFKREGEWFAGAVARDMLRRDLPWDRLGFFGFDTACLETFHALKDRGAAVTICDQIDPARVEQDMVFEEVRKWPGWQDMPGRIPEEYFQRLQAEWAAADLVMVNSQWSKQALVRQGVPAEKQFVVPVAYEPEVLYGRPREVNEDRPLRVLWLGTVNLRKGIPYLVEAARMLLGEAIEFVIAGPLQISRDAVASAPKNMRFIGRVNRVQTADVYRSADVFVLPTVSDGFAITQVEAMGYGLPVITTPNCGEVVTHGTDGLIVPACDSKALADAVLALHRDRSLLQAMSHGAIAKVCDFRLPMQAEVVEAEVAKFLARREGGPPPAPPPPHRSPSPAQTPPPPRGRPPPPGHRCAC